MEVIEDITTARELRDILNNTPDYLLDIPITVFHEDSNVAFLVCHVEVLDIIEDGARTQLIRLTGEGEV
jgi:hypothetical protein